MSRINFLTPIQNNIHLVEERMREQPDGHHPDLYSALEHLLSSGGKRVRPAVALLTGGMYGADPERLVTLGAAIELLHTATLVHDDLIDGALFRRGIATLNARWSPAATVLTGDYVFARAAKLAADTDSVDVMRLFADTLATIVSGELTQMFTSRGLISRDDYYRRIYAKTASMFELATAAAAVLSPADYETVNSAKQIGNDIGMAFQIVDDVLDFTGEQATVGKPLASDLRQGLVTLPAIYYIESHQDDPDLDSLLNNQFYNEEWLDRIVQKIRKSGAIGQAMDEARHFINCALETLRLQPECPERLALEELAQYIIHRSL
ncbi:MAG TPA: polyprenyl synthetase family protein [Anaerolineales bacterium]